jgi:hypothetical protein
METMEGGFIAADPDLLKPLLPGNGGEASNHLLRGIKPSRLLRLDDNVPGPAEEASQTASDAVCCGNPSIIGSGPESIILPLLPGSNDILNFFCPHY